MSVAARSVGKSRVNSVLRVHQGEQIFKNSSSHSGSRKNVRAREEAVSVAPAFFFEKNLGEAEAAAGELTGVVVANECNTFFADFG